MNADHAVSKATPKAPAALPSGKPSQTAGSDPRASEPEERQPGPVQIPSEAGSQVPPADQWDLWEERYSRYLPDTPRSGRQPREVPTVLRTEAEFAELQRVRDGVLKLEDRLKSDRGAVRQRNQERRERWLRALQNAFLAGEEQPPEPPEPERDPWDSGQRLDAGTGIGPADYYFSAMLDRLFRIIAGVEKGVLYERADHWRAVLEQRSQPERERVDAARAALVEAEQALAPFTAAERALDNNVGSVRGAVSGGGHAGEGEQPYDKTAEDYADLDQRAALAVERRGRPGGVEAGHEDRETAAAVRREAARVEKEMGAQDATPGRGRGRAPDRRLRGSR